MVNGYRFGYMAERIQNLPVKDNYFKNIRLESNNSTLDEAFQIALDEIQGNIKNWPGNTNEPCNECLITGAAYTHP